nr:topoisomerase C-terminal repeat-containing protein [Bifidobacterium dentium]
MRKLLTGQKVELKDFTSEKGSKFDAALLIDKDRGIRFDSVGKGKKR